MFDDDDDDDELECLLAKSSKWMCVRAPLPPRRDLGISLFYLARSSSVKRGAGLHVFDAVSLTLAGKIRSVSTSCVVSGVALIPPFKQRVQYAH